MDRKKTNPASPEQHRIWANRLYAMTVELGSGDVGVESIAQHFRKNSRVEKKREEVVSKLLELRALLEVDLINGLESDERYGVDLHHVYFQGGCERRGCHRDERSL